MVYLRKKNLFNGGNVNIDKPPNVEEIIKQHCIQSKKVLTNEEIRNIVVRFAEFLRRNHIAGFNFNECLNGLVVAVEDTLEHIGANPKFRSNGAYTEWSKARLFAGLSPKGADAIKNKKRVSLEDLNLFAYEMQTLLEEKGIHKHFPPVYFWEMRANIMEALNFAGIDPPHDFWYSSPWRNPLDLCDA